MTIVCAAYLIAGLLTVVFAILRRTDWWWPVGIAIIASLYGCFPLR